MILPEGDVHAFTDGSTDPDSENSGYSAILQSERGDLYCNISGGVAAFGNNYIPEATGVLAALCYTPPDRELFIYSDSQALVNALSHGILTERGRIRCAARPFLISITRIIQSRSAGTYIRHVRAHTNGSSIESLGNRKADLCANKARDNVKEAKIARFLENEENIIFTIDKVPVQGDIREQFKAHIRECLIDTWSTLVAQGRLIRTYKDELLTRIKSIRRLQNGDALLYALQMICDWLPLDHRMSKGSATYETDAICKLCLTNEPETIYHFIVCPSNRKLLEGVNTDVKLILNSFNIRVPAPSNKLDHSTMDLIHAHLVCHNTGLTYDEVCYLYNNWRARLTTDMHYSTFLATLDDIAATEAGNRCTFPCLLRDYVCKTLHLCVHLYASPFELSQELPIWFARHSLAAALGSSGDPAMHSWRGFNSWKDATFWADDSGTDHIISKIDEIHSTNLPSRLIIACRENQYTGWKGSTIIGSGATGKGHNRIKHLLVMVVNTESLLVDPIDEASLKSISCPTYLAWRWHSHGAPNLPTSASQPAFPPRAKPSRPDHDLLFPWNAKPISRRWMDTNDKDEQSQLTLTMLGVIPSYINEHIRRSIKYIEDEDLVAQTSIALKTAVTNTIFWSGLNFYRHRCHLKTLWWKARNTGDRKAALDMLKRHKHRLKRYSIYRKRYESIIQQETRDNIPKKRRKRKPLPSILEFTSIIQHRLTTRNNIKKRLRIKHPPDAHKHSATITKAPSTASPLHLYGNFHTHSNNNSLNLYASHSPNFDNGRNSGPPDIGRDAGPSKTGRKRCYITNMALEDQDRSKRFKL